MYAYGMRLRGYSPGCQPMQGLSYRAEDEEHKYWDILIYDRELTEDETNYYDLDYLGEVPHPKDDPTH